MLSKRKNTHSQEVKAKIKEAKAKTAAEVREIKKLNDPVARAERYEALGASLREFHRWGKPKAMDNESAGIGAFLGMCLGIMTGGLILSAMALTAASSLAPVLLFGGALAGTIGGGGLGGLWGGGEERKRLRSEYGSIKNARAMYRLQKPVWEKAEEERSAIRSHDGAAKIRDKFNKFTGPAAAETVTVPVTKPATPAL